jgi:hypothetical protein
MNVFGRNLNGIAKTDGRTGRDHFGNHAASVLVGKNIAPAVTGGLVKGSTGIYAASDIDSASGMPVTGGDIPVAQSNVALARTLGVALGIPSSLLDGDLASNAGGKVVNSALVGVTG